MKLATLRNNGRELGALVRDGRVYPIEVINRLGKLQFATTVRGLLSAGQFDALQQWHDADAARRLPEWHHESIALTDATFGPLYRDPAKIWCIGLNYARHAADLAAEVPQQVPGSFMKPATTIVGPGAAIHIPELSERTTGEAELGLVFKRRCRNVDRDQWQSVLAGFTAVIDMTAEDILRRNTRYLTLCKSFDTFFSFGPILYTPDELPDVAERHVTTVLNGRGRATNSVRNMTFPPAQLVAYHARVMTMLPGDIM